MPEPVVTVEALLPQSTYSGTGKRHLDTILARVACPHCNEFHVHTLGPHADRLHFRVGHCRSMGGYNLAVDKAEVERILVAFGVVKHDDPTERPTARSKAKRPRVRSKPKPTEARTQCVKCGSELPARPPGSVGRPRLYCSRLCRHKVERQQKKDRKSEHGETPDTRP